MRGALLAILLFAFTGSLGHGLVITQGDDQTRTAIQPNNDNIAALNQTGKNYLAKYASTQQRVFIDSALTVFKRSVELSKDARLAAADTKYESLRLLGTAYLISQDTANARYYIMQNVNYYTHQHQFDKVIATWTDYGKTSIEADLNALGQQCYRQGAEIARITKAADKEFYLRMSIVDNMFQIGTNPDEGMDNCLLIIKQFGNRKQNFDKVYWMLAVYFRYKGDMQTSLSYGLSAINAMELYKDTVNADTFYGEAGMIYEVLGQTEKSIYYYKKTLELRKTQAIPEAYILRTAGFIIKGLITLGRFEEALYEARSIERSNPPKTVGGLAIIAQNKAYCYQALKDNANAEKYYLKMITNYDRTGEYNEAIIIAYYDIGGFYVGQKQYAKAQKYIRNIRDPLPSATLERSTELLRFQVDSGMGNYREAVGHYVKYQKVKDAIFDELKSRQIAELQIKYESRQQKNDIELLTKEGQLQRDRVKQAKEQRNLISLGVVLLLIILILLYISYRNGRKKSKEIDLKNRSLNDLLGEKDELLEEKEWLIKEVHHRVKNNLQIVMGLLQRQSSFINNKEALTAIQNSEHRMQSIALIHQKLYQSDNLGLVNMADYISEMVGYLQEWFGLGSRITFEKKIADIDLEVNIAVPMGLILNEAITNSIKYAFPHDGAGCIRMTLEQTGSNSFLLEIADNGRGLSTDHDLEKTNSMGFGLMRGLSKQIGGKLTVSNIDGLTLKIVFHID